MSDGRKLSTYKRTPLSYFLIRWLFQFVLKVFYGTIVVENEEYIPESGQPCILCCNHGNSLTDPLMLVRSVPRKRRNMLRLTAKDTLFGKPNFSSWLIEASGALPMKRQKDHTGEKVDNSKVMEILMSAIESGDMVCLFPEGISRYHPEIAPLKTGVARIASDVLTRNRDDPEFEITILTCSVTYMHREHFRSDVLVTFNPPISLKVKDHPRLLAPADQTAIRDLTSTLQAQISLGTIDAPSWDIVQTAKTAIRLYAPLGTSMTLGDYVRVLRTFVDSFSQLTRPNVMASSSSTLVNGFTSPDEADFSTETDVDPNEELKDLIRDLQQYQNKLNDFGIKDDRIRKPHVRIIIMYRIIVRTWWLIVLTTISLPGLILWLPIFFSTNRAVKVVKNSPGRPSDTWDEIAQAKLVYGLASGIFVWLTSMAIFPLFAPLTAVVVPALMWITLRWLEDAVSSFRAITALTRLLMIGKPKLRETLKQREGLHKRVMEHAYQIGLPGDPEVYFTTGSGNGNERRGQVKGAWNSGAKYFSLRRRRKRDWNEVLRLYDKTDYPDAS